MPREQREPWLAQMPWLRSRPEHEGGLACKLEAVVPSPTVHGYRNKCEFTIGRDAAGAPCVGFVLGRFKLGVAHIGPPTDCPTARRDGRLRCGAAPHSQLLQR